MTDRMPCCIEDSWIQEPADVPYMTPEDSDHYINGGLQDELDERISDDAALATRLGMMIQRISEKNCFPKEELVQTLKQARDRIDPTPAILRKQAG